MTTARRFFDRAPDTWQDLELLVRQAFSEMGYESTRDYEARTVRGKVRVDVHAIKRSSPIPTIVVCECKYWSKPVDQTVVYAVRSICSDIGAHFGLIISKVGFQSGAQETREATNVHLLDFDQFQETFFDEWRTGMFMRLVQVAEPLLPLVYNRFVGKDAELEGRLRNVRVFQKYALFFGKQNYSAYFVNSEHFPLGTIDPRGDPHDLSPITIRTHREFYDISVEGAKDARGYFGV